METTIVYWGYIGNGKENGHVYIRVYIYMESILGLYCGNIGVILKQAFESL